MKFIKAHNMKRIIKGNTAVVAVALVIGTAIGIAVDRFVKKNGTFAPKLVTILSDESEGETESVSEDEAPSDKDGFKE